LNRLIETLPSITDILSKPIELEEPFVEMAARFAHEPGSVVLLSGGDLDCSRYNLMGLCPWLTLEGRTGETTAVVQGQALTVREEPLDVLEKVLEHCRYHGVDISGPISAGLFGYLAYDLKDGLETLPRTSVDDLQLPLLYFSAPTLLLVEDKANGTSCLHAPVFRVGPWRKRSDRSMPSPTL
jgi:para-aminobenzoate synthetase component 1